MSQVMNTNELQHNLNQFTGTENYYRVMPRLVITDGVQYLASQANCYWLMSAIYSHLVSNAIYSAFVVVRLNVSGKSADLILDDGNNGIICTQHIEYTDFPLREMKLYCVSQGKYWVLLLPSEY